MVEVDLHVRPPFETECRGTLVGAAAEKRRHGEDIARPGATPCDPFELTELFQRVDPHVRIRADADSDAAPADLLRGHETIAEVGLRGGADASPRPRLSEKVELVRVSVRRVHDGRVRPEAAGLGQKTGRPRPGTDGSNAGIHATFRS